MVAYYNEIDPYAAQWLKNLILEGHIAPGLVDERSIEDVTPDDIRGFTQCHFFAGIGVWSYALRRAGWPDDRPVWTGSCPCQPFSAAGKGAGFADERHLWPAWEHLISQCKPNVVFGEQVASKDGLGWLDVVHADLENAGYAVGAVDICAAGVGAPHIRQRLYFVAEGMEYAARDGRQQWGTESSERRVISGCSSNGMDNPDCEGLEGYAGHGGATGWQGACRPITTASLSGRLADTSESERRWGASNGDGFINREASRRNQSAGDITRGGAICRMADAKSNGRERAREFIEPTGWNGATYGSTVVERPGPTNGFWRDADWLGCRDGKWRPVEPGTFPLAHGVTARVGRLRAYGNAINAEQAKTFIEAYLDAKHQIL